MTVQIPVGFGLASLIWRPSQGIRDVVATIGYDPPTTDPTAHATTIRTALVAATRPCNASSMSDNWTFMGVRVIEMDDTGPLSGEDMTTVTGTVTGGAVPVNSAILIRKVTGLGGRRNKGRMYIPPLWPVEGSINASGAMTPTDRNTLQSRWFAFFGDMVTAGLPLRLFHSEVPYTPTPITALDVQALLATQRRRMRR